MSQPARTLHNTALIMANWSTVKLCRTFNITKVSFNEYVKRIYGKPFGQLEFPEKVRICENRLLIQRGIYPNKEATLNLETIRHDGEEMYSLIQEALKQIKYEGNPKEILKYLPASVYEAMIALALSPKDTGEGKINKLLMQLPIINNAELKQIKKDQQAIEVKVKDVKTEQGN